MLSYEELGKKRIFVNNRRVTSYGCFVGRPSLLGNPFVVGKDGSREEVIRNYRIWLLGEDPGGGSCFSGAQEALGNLASKGEHIPLVFLFSGGLPCAGHWVCLGLAEGRF